MRSAHAFALLVLLVGCAADEDGPPLMPVSGRVTFDGQPMTTGLVRFWPDEKRGNSAAEPASAAITAEGRFELNTLGRAGVAPGWYKVTVTAASDDGTLRQLLPERYGSPVTSALALEVVVTPDTGRYDLRLTK